MPRILAVDRDPFIRDMVVRLLKQSNYYASEASNLLDAARQLRAQPADLVITEMIMPADMTQPGMEGMEFIRLLKREFPTTKIIAVSGGGIGSAEGYLKIASALGAHKTFTKPFLLSDLLGAVSELLHPAGQNPDGRKLGDSSAENQV